MVLEAGKLNPFKIGEVKNPFASSKTSFTGGGQPSFGAEYSERHGNGKAAGVNSTGVHGSVTGTGNNGEHLLDQYF
jgi:hypothetical protein